MKNSAWLLFVIIYVFISHKSHSTIKCQTPNSSNLNTSTILDKRDNEVYEIIKIVDQVWFKSNLRYISKDSKCYDNRKKNCKYGRLYSVENLDNICPEGWRVPNLNDWNKLKGAFGKDSIYAQLDTLSWEDISNHTNQSGLSLKGDGYQFDKREFFGQGRASSIWLNQINQFDEYYHAHLYGGKGTYFKKSDNQTNEILHAHPIDNLKHRRFSIRCICNKPNELMR